MAIPKLQYFEKALVDGIPGKSLVVRAADGRVLGRFRGLVIDPLDQHLRFLVVRATGWFGRTTLVPACSPRLDLDRCAIEIDAVDSDIALLRNLTLRRALNLGMCVRAA